MATYVKIGRTYYLEEDIHKIFKPRINHTKDDMGAAGNEIYEWSCTENCPVE